jgi:hypothetical protein
LSRSLKVQGTIIDSFTYLRDQMPLDEAETQLEKKDYGIVTGKGGQIVGLIKAENLRRFREGATANEPKKLLWDSRRHWQPAIIVSLKGQEVSDFNYPTIKIDPSTARSGANGIILSIDDKVENIIAFKDVFPSESTDSVLVQPVRIFSELASADLPGNFGVSNRTPCKICGELITYSYYSRENPPECINGHKLIF